jgi:hypothetical protein
MQLLIGQHGDMDGRSEIARILQLNRDQIEKIAAKHGAVRVRVFGSAAASIWRKS